MLVGWETSTASWLFSFSLQVIAANADSWCKSICDWNSSVEHWSLLLLILLCARQVFASRHLHARMCHLYSLLCNKVCEKVLSQACVWIVHLTKKEWPFLKKLWAHILITQEVHLLETDSRVLLKSQTWPVWTDRAWNSVSLFFCRYIFNTNHDMPWTGNLGKQMGFPGIEFPGLLAVGGYCILFWRECIFQCHNGILSIFKYNGSLLILSHGALPGMAQPDTILLQHACENSLISALSFQARN